MSLVVARGLTKTYRAGEVDVPAIKGADFVIEPASLVAFVGPSGSGNLFDGHSRTGRIGPLFDPSQAGRLGHRLPLDA